MAATPTGPPALVPEPDAPRGYAAALRLVLLWGPITGYASLLLGSALTTSDASDAVKTVAFFGTVACCLLVLAGTAMLEARRIHAASPAANLDLLRLVAIAVALVDISVIATAFTGFQVAYEIQ